MIGFVGGSFDPIHTTHLQMAVRANYCDAVYFLPTPLSPLKSTKTAVQARLDMLKLGIEYLQTHLYPIHSHAKPTQFAIDTRELTRPPPIYSIDTFAHIRAECSDTLIFIMGEDSLLDLPKWQGGLNLLNFCHIHAICRPDGAPKNTDKDMLLPYLCQSPHDFDTQKNGLVYLDDSPLAQISSTKIRQNVDAHKHFLAPSVYAYIKRHKLYSA